MRALIVRLAAAALAVSLCATPAQAALQSLTGLYVFGDSLSDGGNYNGPGGPGAFPPFPYAGARYSNGPTAVEYLWNAYNPGNPGGFTPSNFGGTNYALGGATTGTANFNSVNPGVPGMLQPYFTAQGGIGSQVAQFAGTCAGCFDPTSSLFVVWGFPNNVFLNAAMGGPLTPAQLIAQGLADIQSAILTLAAEGARHFLVPNMPNLGITPAFAGTGDAAGATALTQAFNFNLAGLLTALDSALPIEIVQFDTYAALDDLVANPGAYGLTNVTQQCVQNLLPGPGQCDPGTWLFWDSVHPTTAGHAILGAQFSAAVPEPGTLALLGFALLAVGFARRRA